ncbi:MAG TPA: hypothetical protein VF103_06960 [Polyangiaceae bacterium]
MKRLCGWASSLALGLVSCSRSLTPAECDALLDRYVEKLVGSDRPGTSAAELVELQRRARATAAQDPAFADCRSAVSRKKFECAMQAETVDRMEICLL